MNSNVIVKACQHLDIMPSKCYQNTNHILLPNLTPFPKQIIDVVHQDTLDAGRELQDLGYRPVLLNMASDFCPGGGWRKGALAQEESLFYRTSYHRTLGPCRSFYPLPLLGAIYSPQVHHLLDKQQLPAADQRIFDFIAMAGIRRPPLDPKGQLSAKDQRIWQDKIHGLFRLARLHDHDSIVLSAWGSGAFRNPADQVAQIFKAELDRFRWFRHVRFAILGQENFQAYQMIMGAL